MGAEEVLRIGKKLEKLISTDTSDHASALDLLKALRDSKMSLEVLQKTRIGMTVNNLRKASNTDEVITLAKTLIKNWKKLLPAESPGGLSRSTSRSSGGDASQKMDEGSQDDGDDGKKAKNTDDDEQTSGRSSAYSTSDPVRLKCRDYLRGALKSSDIPDGAHDPDDLADEIEDSIFTEFANTEVKYKNRVRSRVANLKDSRNPQLRQNVLIGLISAQKIASMTADEMASREMKDLREKLTKEAINDHQMAKTGGTTTSLFKCGKCGKYNCTYNQVQTRSADEPMTTFVLCNACGNRWKFC